jgi:rod shape-determining protein MreD
MTPVVRYTIRFVVLILVQYLLCTEVPLGNKIVPYLYFVYILWLPINLSRFWLMIIGFVVGLTLDFLLLTPGVHAAACVLIAYLRPWLITLMLPKEVTEIKYMEPSVRSMGLTTYAVYVGILTAFHHAYLIFIQWIKVGNLWFFIQKIVLTTLVSLILIIVAELLTNRKRKIRGTV